MKKCFEDRRIEDADKWHNYFDLKFAKFKYKWFGIKPKWPEIKAAPRKNEFFIETCPYSGHFYPKIRITKEKVIKPFDVFTQPKIDIETEEFFIWVETRAPQFFGGEFQIKLSYRFPVESKDPFTWTNESGPRRSILPCKTIEDAMDRIKLYDELVLGNNIKKDIVILNS